MKNHTLFILLLFAITTSNSFAQFGGLLNKVKEKAKETVSPSTPKNGDLIQPDACISNVKSRIETIVNVYYANFKNDPNFVKKEGSIWFARKDFEVARWVYSCGTEGFQSGGQICESMAKSDSRYVDLKEIYNDAEAKVVEMEKAKGLVFDSCSDNNVLFKVIKTGKILTANESNKM